MADATAASASCVIAEAHPGLAVGLPRIDAISDVVPDADAGDDARSDGDENDSGTAVRRGGGGDCGPAARVGSVDPDAAARDDALDRPRTGCKDATEDAAASRELEAMMSETSDSVDGDDELLEEVRREEIRKGKQKAVSFDASGGSPSTRGQKQGVILEKKTPPTPPTPKLQDPDIPWEKNAERSPQKLPIRFKDCVGRTFVLPWRRVRTWRVRRARRAMSFPSLRIANSCIGHEENDRKRLLRRRFSCACRSGWSLRSCGMGDVC
jgi:hypothetical protein